MECRKYFTASAASRVAACPPSGVFPAVRSVGDKATIGSAGHRCLEVRGKTKGSDAERYAASLAEVDAAADAYELSDVARSVLASRVSSFRWVPPQDCETELPMALNATDFSVRVIPAADAAPGNYKLLDGEGFSGTADLVFRRDDVLWVTDYKFGSDVNVVPVQHNKQLLGLAQMALTVLPTPKVMPAVIHVWGDENGLWEMPEGGPWDSDGPQMSAFRSKFCDLLEKLEVLRARYSAGDTLASDVVVGSHCVYCPCVCWCPVYVSVVSKFVGKDVQVSGMSEEQLREAIGMMRAAEAVLYKLKRALEARVRDLGTVVSLGDGLAWGPHPTSKERVVPSRQTFDLLWAALAEGIGEQHFWDIFSIPKSALYGAAKLVAAKTGKKISHVNKAVLGELKQANCIQRVESEVVGMYRTDGKVDSDNDGQ